MVFNRNKFLKAFKKGYSDTVENAVERGDISFKKGDKLTNGLEEDELESESRWAEEVINELKDVEINDLEID
jgi:hypothetical protein